MDLFNLDPPRVDALMRPIFEAAGIADDFMPERERFPLDSGLQRAEQAELHHRFLARRRSGHLAGFSGSSAALKRF